MTDDSPFDTNGSSAGTSWIPTDPNDYVDTEHFRQRADSDERIVNDRLAAQAIRSGGPEAATEGKWVFSTEGSGFELRVVCGLGDYLVPSLVTGYCRVFDLARVIDRFGERKANAERLRFIVAGGDDWDAIRSLDIPHPVSVDGHRVTTVPGSGTLVCTNCGLSFRSTEQIDTDCQ